MHHVTEWRSLVDGVIPISADAPYNASFSLPEFNQFFFNPKMMSGLLIHFCLAAVGLTY